MKKKLTTFILIVFVLGGLFVAMAVRMPKPPPPSTREIWAKEGIPVETGTAVIGDMEQTVEVTGDIAAMTKVVLSSKIPGRIARVLVREGDKVAPGTTVAILDQADALANLEQAEAALQAARTRLSQAITNAKVTRIQTKAAIEQAKAAVESAEARLAVAKKPARSQEQLVAENAVASAKANLENAEANYKRHQQLLKEGAISQAAFDVVKTQYAVAQSEYKSAQERLSLIKEGGRREDIIAAQAAVDQAKEQLRTARANDAQNLLREEDVRQASAAVKQAEAALALAKQQLSYTVIKSTISGEVASRQADPGQVVSAGQPIVEVVNLDSVYLKGELSEKNLAVVRKGQPANVRIDAIPGKVFRGVVDEIYPSGSVISRNFPVRIRIDRAQSLIRPGMFARAEIVTGVDRNVLLVPKDAVAERHGTKLVFTVERNNVARRHDVIVVRENREYVEITATDGLRQGDVVVTRGHQNLQNGSVVNIANGAK